jgi:hypothetical protein
MLQDNPTTEVQHAVPAEQPPLGKEPAGQELPTGPVLHAVDCIIRWTLRGRGQISFHSSEL